MTSNLTRCPECAALTAATDDDAARHRGWHLDYDKKFRNTRNAAVEARDALGGLRAQLKTYQDDLAEHEPDLDPITVTEMPADTELGLDPDDTIDDQDDDADDDDLNATVALEPADLPDQTHHNLYTPRISS